MISTDQIKPFLARLTRAVATIRWVGKTSMHAARPLALTDLGQTQASKSSEQDLAITL